MQDRPVDQDISQVLPEASTELPTHAREPHSLSDSVSDLVPDLVSLDIDKREVLVVTVTLTVSDEAGGEPATVVTVTTTEPAATAVVGVATTQKDTGIFTTAENTEWWAQTKAGGGALSPTGDEAETTAAGVAQTTAAETNGIEQTTDGIAQTTKANTIEQTIQQTGAATSTTTYLWWTPETTWGVTPTTQTGAATTTATGRITALATTPVTTALTATTTSPTGITQTVITQTLSGTTLTSAAASGTTASQATGSGSTSSEISKGWPTALPDSAAYSELPIASLWYLLVVAFASLFA